ncbi:hypothetical protein ANI02nite_30090 [Acetobacter nitrogenifigens DSM 23921 = NBRC 105050]|uniref:Uncharacterized protein n=1 Tax=Acetobacter nitrogenifigens DSM 23921 = NBRC 105050 TaxID=1120919 RepID=A0A511XE19_9PROT|nr:hypothetical protein ANI02nite_30090 [Acetobacter nitrogenifigens DSM 23921 = NBRC 105050]
MNRDYERAIISRQKDDGVEPVRVETACQTRIPTRPPTNPPIGGTSDGERV